MIRRALVSVLLCFILALTACTGGNQGGGSVSSQDSSSTASQDSGVAEDSLLSIIREVMEHKREFEAVYTNKNGYERKKTIDKAEILEMVEVTNENDTFLCLVRYRNHSWEGEALFAIPDFTRGEIPAPSDIEIMEYPTASPLVDLDFTDPAIYPAFEDKAFNYRVTPDSRLTSTPVNPDTIEKIVMVEFVPEEVQYNTGASDTGQYEDYILEIHLKDGLKIKGSVFFRYSGLESQSGMEKWGTAVANRDFLQIQD